jgi:hypothetical protein
MKSVRFYLLVLAAFLGTTGQAFADAACENACTDAWDQCVQNCGTDYWCWLNCDQLNEWCHTDCASCPSTRDYSTTTILSRSYTNRNGCFQDHLYLGGGRRYYEYFTKERKNNYRETTQCNGTKSTQLLSSSTYNYYCWTRGNTLSDACSNPAPNYLFICY